MDVETFLSLYRIDSSYALYYFYVQYLESQDVKLRFRFNPNSITDKKFISRFRFDRCDFPRLIRALKLPETIQFGIRMQCSTEEALYILLRRLAYPNRLDDLEDIFGRPTSVLSLIINRILDLIYTKYQHLLTNVRHPWMTPENLVRFSRAVYRKGAPLRNCIGFIDGTLREICRPGYDQRENYNGHKRCHGLKFQSVVLPNGIISNLRGPYPGRRHDCYMLTESDLLADLDEHVPGYCLYGDPAYPLRPQLICPYKGANLTVLQQSFNKLMSSVRQSVEWEFGKVMSKFAFLDFSKNLKLDLMPVGKYYLVGVLLANCHTCLYSSQTSDYFGVNPPEVEEYLYLEP